MTFDRGDWENDDVMCWLLNCLPLPAGDLTAASEREQKVYDEFTHIVERRCDGEFDLGWSFEETVLRCLVILKHQAAPKSLPREMAKRLIWCFQRKIEQELGDKSTKHKHKHKLTGAAYEAACRAEAQRKHDFGEAD